jgi:hypothetical protein
MCVDSVSSSPLWETLWDPASVPCRISSPERSRVQTFTLAVDALETRVTTLRYARPPDPPLCSHLDISARMLRLANDFTETKREVRIVREGVFRPVAVVVELEDADDAVRQANDTLYRRVCSDSLLPIYPPSFSMVWPPSVNVEGGRISMVRRPFANSVRYSRSEVHLTLCFRSGP